MVEDFRRRPPTAWTQADVRDWLVAHGCSRWSDEIAFRHRVDGAVLLTLCEEDLRLPPLSIDCLGDIKRINAALAELRDNGSANFSVDRRDIPLENGHCTFLKSRQHHKVVECEMEQGNCRKTIFISSQELIRCVESPDTAEKSMVKLTLALLYCLFSLLVTSFVMVLVHDRVPNMKTYPPLPDILLDNIPLIPWAFECCELIGLVMALFWMTVLVFHKHRIVILRRMFSLTGSIFLLRCVTMLITSLSVPGIHLECRAYSYGNLRDKLHQAFNIWIHLGMSIQGVRTCGDYMFSGHTATITLLNHFITEYTPENWRGVHTLMWVLNIFGVFFILAGHEHYSIDVFIAFYITSRMFLSYHANAYNYASMGSVDERMRIWFPLGWFFESGAIGRVKNEFEVPPLFSICRNYLAPTSTLSKSERIITEVTVTPAIISTVAETSAIEKANDAIRRRKSKK